MADRLALPRRYRDQLEALLREHVPGVEVWAYGSRVNGESHDGSDLDLVLRGSALEALDGGFYDLLEAIEKSNIPFLVQVHDWAMLPESFHREIKRDYVVVQLGAAKGARSDAAAWVEATVGELSYRVTKGTTPTTVGGHFVSEGISFVKAESIRDDGRFDATKFAYIDDETNQLLARSVLQQDDVLFTIAGTIGRVAWVQKDILPANTNQAVAIVRPNQALVNPRFLYYVLRDDVRTKRAFTRVVQSVQANFSLSELSSLEIPLPPLPEQRAIAHILGTLDDKIELNRRMNETLEAMARALFKSWFVDFDPVRAKMEGRLSALPDGEAGGQTGWRRGESLPGLPAYLYDLFPDRLVDSELGEIPEGWGVGVLDDVIELLSGGTPKTSVPGYWGGDIPWYTAKDAPNGSDVFVLDTERTITQSGVENSATRTLAAGTTVITARGTVGRLACLGVPMAMNQTCYGIRGAHGYPDFFTYWNLKTAVDELQTRTHGTIFDTITRQTFTLVEMALAPINLALVFEAMVEPVMAHILNNLRESRTLGAQRDALLPGLMSGEVSAGELTQW